MWGALGSPQALPTPDNEERMERMSTNIEKVLTVVMEMQARMTKMHGRLTQIEMDVRNRNASEGKHPRPSISNPNEVPPHMIGGECNMRRPSYTCKGGTPQPVGGQQRRMSGRPGDNFGMGTGGPYLCDDDHSVQGGQVGSRARKGSFCEVSPSVIGAEGATIPDQPTLTLLPSADFLDSSRPHGSMPFVPQSKGNLHSSRGMGGVTPRKAIESLWLKEEGEFEALLDDETQVEMLLWHLESTKASHQAQLEGHNAVDVSWVSRRWKGIKRSCSTRLGLYLYRSWERCCKNLTQSPNGVSGHWRTLWDMLQTGLIAFSLLFVPLRLAHPEAFNAHSSIGWNIFELVLDMVLLSDSAVWMLTPYFKDERSMLVTEPRSVALHYMCTKLPYDILVGFPMDIVLRQCNVDGLGKFARVVQFLRAAKLVRTSRSWRASKSYKHFLNQFTSGSLTLLAPLSIMFLLWHWLCCLWWFVATNDGSDNMSQRWFNDEHGDSSVYHNSLMAYIVSFHWVLTITTCLGANTDISGSPLQGLLEGFTAVIGTLMQTFVFGSAASIINRMDEARRARQTKLENVRGFIQQRGVPSFIGQRVIQFYEHMATVRMKPAEEVRLLEELPSTLRLQVAIVLNQRFLTRVSIFSKFDSRSIALMSLVLTQRSFLPDEVIFTEGKPRVHGLRAGPAIRPRYVGAVPFALARSSARAVPFPLVSAEAPSRAVPGAVNDSLHFVRTGVLNVYVKSTATNGMWGVGGDPSGHGSCLNDVDSSKHGGMMFNEMRGNTRSSKRGDNSNHSKQQQSQSRRDSRTRDNSNHSRSDGSHHFGDASIHRDASIHSRSASRSASIASSRGSFDGGINRRLSMQSRRRRRWGAWRPGQPLKQKVADSAAIKKERDDIQLGRLVGTLREGAAFGEQSFLAKTRAKASIRTVVFSELMSLHRSHLEAIFDRNEALRDLVQNYLDEQMSRYQAQMSTAYRERRGTKLDASNRLSRRHGSSIKAAMARGAGLDGSSHGSSHGMRSRSSSPGGCRASGSRASAAWRKSSRIGDMTGRMSFTGGSTHRFGFGSGSSFHQRSQSLSGPTSPGGERDSIGSSVLRLFGMSEASGSSPSPFPPPQHV